MLSMIYTVACFGVKECQWSMHEHRKSLDLEEVVVVVEVDTMIEDTEEIHTETHTTHVEDRLCAVTIEFWSRTYQLDVISMT